MRKLLALKSNVSEKSDIWGSNPYSIIFLKVHTAPSSLYSGFFNNIFKKYSISFIYFSFWNSYLSAYFSLNYIFCLTYFILVSICALSLSSLLFFKLNDSFYLAIFLRCWIWKLKSSYRLSLDFFYISCLRSLWLILRSLCKWRRGELSLECCLERENYRLDWSMSLRYFS